MPASRLSSGSDHRFVPALRRISRELAVAEPLKSRIILEMAADLESLYEHYLRSGADEKRAAEEAEKRLLADPEALRRLVELHTRPYQRFLANAVRRTRWGVELLIFAFGVLPVLAAAVALVREVGPDGIGVIGLLLLVAAGVVAGIAVWKGVQLFGRASVASSDLHHGIFALFFLGSVTPLLGGIGLLLSLYRTGSSWQGSGEAAVSRAAGLLATGGMEFSLGIIVAISAGLLWHLLVARIARIEQSECVALLSGRA